MKRVLQVLQDGKCLLRSDENRFVAGDGTCFNRYHRIVRHKLMEDSDLVDSKHRASHL